MVLLMVCFLVAAYAATYALESSIADGGGDQEVAAFPDVTATWQESGAVTHTALRAVGSDGDRDKLGAGNSACGRATHRFRQSVLLFATRAAHCGHKPRFRLNRKSRWSLPRDVM